VALDPGGDLSGWQRLRWLDRRTGHPVRVSTTRADIDAVQLTWLADKGADWSRPPTYAPITEVVVDPLWLDYRGRVSAVIDADIDGLPGDLDARRPVYVDGEDLGVGQREVLVDLALRLSHAEFARRARTTPRIASDIAAGALPRIGVVRGIVKAIREVEQVQRVCALDGCEHPVQRVNQASSATPAARTPNNRGGLWWLTTAGSSCRTSPRTSSLRSKPRSPRAVS
jgi:hypothetical protein